MGQARGQQTPQNRWSRLGISPRQFAKRVGVTFSMAEFVVHGRRRHRQSPTFLQSPKDNSCSLQATCLTRARTTAQSKPKSSSSWRCPWSSTPTRALMTSDTTAQGKLAINTCRHATDTPQDMMTIIDSESSTKLGIRNNKTSQFSHLAKPKKWALYYSISGQRQTQQQKFGASSQRQRASCRRRTLKPKSYKRLLCQGRTDNVHLPNDPVQWMQTCKNTEQVPSVVVSQEAGVQTCLQPLFSVRQMFEFKQQISQTMDDEKALMEQEEEEKDCKDKDRFQGSGQSILQVGDEMAEYDEGKEGDEEENTEPGSSSFGWWELLRTWLQAVETYLKS